LFIFGLFIFFQGDQDGFDGPLLSNTDCQKVMAMFARGGLRQHRNWQKGVAGSYIGPDIPVPGLENGITSRVNERTEEGIFFSFLFPFTGIPGSLQCGHVVDGMPARIYNQSYSRSCRSRMA